MKGEGRGVYCLQEPLLFAVQAKEKPDNQYPIPLAGSWCLWGLWPYYEGVQILVQIGVARVGYGHALYARLGGGGKKKGLGASHQVDPSPPETTAIVQSDVRGGSSTPWGGLKRKHGAGKRTPVRF